MQHGRHDRPSFDPRRTSIGRECIHGRQGAALNGAKPKWSFGGEHLSRGAMGDLRGGLAVRAAGYFLIMMFNGPISGMKPIRKKRA